MNPLNWGRHASICLAAQHRAGMDVVHRSPYRDDVLLDVIYDRFMSNNDGRSWRDTQDPTTEQQRRFG